MPTINVLNGHVLSDLADEQLLFEAADLNGIGITDALVAGVTLQVPVRAINKTDLLGLTKRAQEVTVLAIAGQTWIDLALQQLGDEQKLFDLCDANAAGITDLLTGGETIKSIAVDFSKRRLVNEMQKAKPSS